VTLDPLPDRFAHRRLRDLMADDTPDDEPDEPDVS